MSAAAVLKLKERQGDTQRQSLLELRHDEQAFIAQVLFVCCLVASAERSLSALRLKTLHGAACSALLAMTTGAPAFPRCCSSGQTRIASSRKKTTSNLTVKLPCALRVPSE
jgi:hypothetical protein